MHNEEAETGAKMTNDETLMSGIEARQLAEKFLLAMHFDSKIDSIGCQLIITDNIQIYQLHGELTMRSRSWLARFTAPKSANKFDFSIEIDAQRGKIIDCEIK
jgi:hypothetical protein